MSRKTKDLESVVLEQLEEAEQRKAHAERDIEKYRRVLDALKEGDHAGQA